MKNSSSDEKKVDRRQFMLNSTLAAGAAAGLLTARTNMVEAAPKRSIIKSLKFGMIQPKDKKASIEDKLRVAKEAGFASVEPNTIFRATDLAKFSAGAEKVGIEIDAIVCSTHWGKPLTDPDPEIYEQTIKGMRTSMLNVKDLGGDMVLLVPAVVNENVGYEVAWKRAVERTKMLAEDAERLNVTIGIENVWNKFLLSPLEARAFIDEIDSKFVKFWFDVGNVVQFAYPEDWIRTLGGDRIARVDVKDFKREGNQWKELGKGSVDWTAVMTAFDEIGYEGYFAAEVSGGDKDYLIEAVSKPMDRFIAL